MSQIVAAPTTSILILNFEFRIAVLAILGGERNLIKAIGSSSVDQKETPFSRT
ncbi:MAG: hypothetical protein AAGF66_14070 [Cyanobacteria bacterium P01_H01_bin.119]